MEATPTRDEGEAEVDNVQTVGTAKAVFTWMLAQVPLEQRNDILAGRTNLQELVKRDIKLVQRAKEVAQREHGLASDETCSR